MLQIHNRISTLPVQADENNELRNRLQPAERQRAFSFQADLLKRKKKVKHVRFLDEVESSNELHNMRKARNTKVRLVERKLRNEVITNKNIAV